jgi:GntR family transcriptional regulator/MocR family aminotransferase
MEVSAAGLRNSRAPVSAGRDDELAAPAGVAGVGAALGTLIFEDDYDSEYRYWASDSCDRTDRSGVVMLEVSVPCSFTLRRISRRAGGDGGCVCGGRSVSTHHPPLLEQAILCDFITEGHFARHIRRMRELYAERLELR